MEQKKIDRINELARKARIAPLTNEEAEEQNRLRQEYLDDIRASFSATLEHTVIEYPDGTRKPLKKHETK
ncbi:MAG: DUF896 domain-containing protein [Eubacteriales bacterium]